MQRIHHIMQRHAGKTPAIINSIQVDEQSIAVFKTLKRKSDVLSVHSDKSPLSKRIYAIDSVVYALKGTDRYKIKTLFVDEMLSFNETQCRELHQLMIELPSLEKAIAFSTPIKAYKKETLVLSIAENQGFNIESLHDDSKEQVEEILSDMQELRDKWLFGHNLQLQFHHNDDYLKNIGGDNWRRARMLSQENVNLQYGLKLFV